MSIVQVHDGWQPKQPIWPHIPFSSIYPTRNSVISYKCYKMIATREFPSFSQLVMVTSSIATIQMKINQLCVRMWMNFNQLLCVDFGLCEYASLALGWDCELPFFFFIHFISFSIGSKVNAFRQSRLKIWKSLGHPCNRVFLNDFQVHPRCVSFNFEGRQIGLE